ncbi:MAG TPA: alpha/beta fold hydrolase [Gemmatimonadales bacterium]|nr:alpha/beta fold hydrolase [Gemmatimonadales bacterium]
MILRHVTTTDGVRLALYRARADRAGRPAVLLLHGMFSNHGVFLRPIDRGPGLAPVLAERGLDVWLADFRHHGGSDREPAPRRWTFEDWIRADLPALAREVGGETGGAPLAWVGHSAGGVTALCALAENAPLRRQVAAVVTLGVPGPKRMGALRWSLAALSALLSPPFGRFPARALRMGPEDEAARVLSQWMGWNARGRWSSRDGFDYLAALSSVPTPLFAVAGEADRIFAPPARCRELFDAWGAPGKRFAVARDLDHRGLLIDPRARDSTWPALGAWLEETLDR